MKKLIISLQDEDINYSTEGDFSYFELFGLIECFKLRVSLEYKDRNDDEHLKVTEVHR